MPYSRYHALTSFAASESVSRDNASIVSLKCVSTQDEITEVLKAVSADTLVVDYGCDCPLEYMPVLLDYIVNSSVSSLTVVGYEESQVQALDQQYGMWKKKYDDTFTCSMALDGLDIKIGCAVLCACCRVCFASDSSFTGATTLNCSTKRCRKQAASSRCLIMSSGGATHRGSRLPTGEKRLSPTLTLPPTTDPCM